jgi:uncharacterized protein with FMN-binding domain
MKKVLLSLFIIVSFLIYALRQKGGNSSVSNNQTGSLNNGIPSTVLGNSTSANMNYKEGTYTGSTVDAFYGNVQVQIVIKSGRIADVQFLQYPNDRSRSIEISNAVMSMLRKEAIQAQSAQVDIVSGASDTSQAFIQSLDSALIKANSN